MPILGGGKKEQTAASPLFVPFSPPPQIGIVGATLAVGCQKCEVL